ncbi:MAG: aldehyde dehydrogenase family protein [Gammaproteobacteria bacterium]|nr:aldehyde dehydrogenase family protein [Gammaproteobacteria bacterium]
MHELLCHSPIDGQLVARRPYAEDAAIAAAFEAARLAQHGWRRRPVAERAALCTRFVDAVVAQTGVLADELTLQMGRPRRYAENEIHGFETRARHMIAIAEEALADIRPEAIAGFNRFLRREPLGTVFIVAPWNYPWLTTVNALIPALMAGNSVVLKPSAQTPLVAERLAEAARRAELPEGLFQVLYLSHAQTHEILGGADLDAVFFTGSVAGGIAVEEAVKGRFLHVGLELGGCDPAYVRADANLAQAVDSIVDGAMFNSGQSCCGIQRIYVHTSLYDGFCQEAAALLKHYVLADPRRPETTLGPLAKHAAAADLRRVAAEALEGGARDLLPPEFFPRDDGQGAYAAPRLLAEAHHGLSLMREECFAPIAGVMRVGSDEEALSLMNDSRYGLTAAIYSGDAEAALALGERLDTGTVFLNRCDVLDPALAWTGVKNTGRGCTLSRLGYETLTRPKSFHFKTEL